MNVQTQNRPDRREGTTFPPRWDPQRPFERLVGTVERYTWGETPWGERLIANVRDRHGQRWSVWLSRAVLRQKWEEERPQPGDGVIIVYRGKRRGRRFTCHDYDLLVNRRERENDRSAAKLDQEA